MSVNDLEAQHLARVRDRQLDGLARGLVEILHIGERDVAQGAVARDQLTELEEP